MKLCSSLTLTLTLTVLWQVLRFYTYDYKISLIFINVWTNESDMSMKKSKIELEK